MLRAKDHTKVTGIVHVADIFVKTRGIGKSGDYTRSGVQPEITALLALNKIDMSSFQAELERGVKECESFLHIDKLGTKEDESGKPGGSRTQ